MKVYDLQPSARDGKGAIFQMFNLKDKAMKKVSAKEVLTSNGNQWIITKVLQGYNGKIRIDAKTRFHIPDEANFFSKWISKTYADRIRREEGLKPVNELNCFQY